MKSYCPYCKSELIPTGTARRALCLGGHGFTFQEIVEHPERFTEEFPAYTVVQTDAGPGYLVQGRL